MLPEPHYANEVRFLQPTIRPQSHSKKTNIVFTYHSSPVASPQDSLKVIRELNQSRRKKKIFEPIRKMSFNSIDSTNKRKSRLKIFESQPIKPLPQMTSHIFLKDSVISNQTIVDQLEQLEESQSLKNPITKKLSSMKTKKNQPTKRTFYSNTVKNSLLLHDKGDTNTKRNRIQSEVLNYNFIPGKIQKNYSLATVKASKDTKGFAGSKYSNGLSVITNNITQNNHNINMFSAFKDSQNVQTPKYHRNTYRSMRKSFDPTFMGDFDKRQKELFSNNNEAKKQSISPEPVSYPPTDRFYDESSLETPRLPTISKKISYEVIDPLTNSLRKQKIEKRQLLRRLNLEEEAMKNATPLIKENKLTGLLAIIMASVNNLAISTKTKVSRGTQTCVNFTRSELFVIIIIVMLSLAIFMIQLVQ